MICGLGAPVNRPGPAFPFGNKEPLAADDPWLDGDCFQQAKVTQDRLRGVLEATGREPRFREDVTFDIAGNGQESRVVLSALDR